MAVYSNLPKMNMIIRDTNPIKRTNVNIGRYTDEDFLNDVFLDEQELKTLKSILKYKKNIILQGAPGVGKTYSAKRQAYTIMGEKDDSRISIVQLHQNNSYEDFVMGYKPQEEKIELKKGIFYKFCITCKIPILVFIQLLWIWNTLYFPNILCIS